MNSPLRDIHEASIGPSRPKTLLTIPSSGSENSEMNSNYIIRIREQNMGRKLHIRPIPTTPIGSDSVLPAPNHRPGMAMNIPEIVLAKKNPCPTSKPISWVAQSGLIHQLGDRGRARSGEIAGSKRTPIIGT